MGGLASVKWAPGGLWVAISTLAPRWRSGRSSDANADAVRKEVFVFPACRSNLKLWCTIFAKTARKCPWSTKLSKNWGETWRSSLNISAPQETSAGWRRARGGLSVVELAGGSKTTHTRHDAALPRARIWIFRVGAAPSIRPSSPRTKQHLLEVALPLGAEGS